MRDSFSLGTIAGVRIGLNWSVLLLLGLLMWTLATGIFPETNPGLGDNTYFAMAVVASLVFFASILLHELGHAVQARRDGMEIDGITLWLFGGVARFTGMFPSPGAEFRIAVAGPLVSLALGGGFVGIALAPGLPEPVNAVCAWLGFINLALLAFNLLPALPLDGGRMLRAGLWRWKGDLRSATRLAAGGGRVIAFALIGLGVAMFILQGAFSGIWLAVIGWFLLQASAAESRVIERTDPLAGMRVGDLMVRDPVTTSPEETLARLRRPHRLGAPPHRVPGRRRRPRRRDDAPAVPRRGAARGLGDAAGGRLHGRPRPAADAVGRRRPRRGGHGAPRLRPRARPRRRRRAPGGPPVDLRRHPRRRRLSRRRSAASPRPPWRAGCAAGAGRG